MPEDIRRHPSRVRFETRAVRFVSEYLKDLNGTKACERMGYEGDCGQAAHAFLRDPFTKALIEARLSKLVAQNEIAQETVLNELGTIAFSDPRGYFDTFGNVKPVHEWTREQAAAVAAIDVTEVIDESSDGSKVKVTRTSKIKFWDKGAALDKLGRYLKLWEAAKQQVNVNVDNRSVTVHQHASSEGALRAVDELIARALAIGAAPDPAAPGANGPVLPVALPVEPGGHGTPVDDRAHQGGAE